MKFYVLNVMITYKYFMESSLCHRIKIAENAMKLEPPTPPYQPNVAIRNHTQQPALIQEDGTYNKLGLKGTGVESPCFAGGMFKCRVASTKRDTGSNVVLLPLEEIKLLEIFCE